MLGIPLPGIAFDNGSTWFDFHYNLKNADARSLAMGGAAVATVEDSSAVLTNPAALMRLSHKEFRFDSTYLHCNDVNRAGVSNIGTGQSIRLGLQSDEISQLNPGLMALAIPSSDRKSAIGLFYHKLLPYDRFITVTDPLSGGVVETHNVMFDLDEFGFSVARDLFEGRLAIGLSASLVTLNMDIKAMQDATPAPGSFNGAEFATYGSQTEQEPNWRFGLLYQPSPKLAIGLNYSIAPNPDYTMTTANSPATINSAVIGGCRGDFNNGVLPNNTPVGNWICKSSLPLPESTSFGISYSPNREWTFAAEATIIDYARITKEFHSPYAYPGGDVTIIQSPQQFKTETVAELHLGLEYQTEMKQRTLVLRAGYFFDPAHDIKYSGGDATSQVIYTGGQDVQHLSAGIGLMLGNTLQLDVAFDVADDHSHLGAVSFAYKY